MQDFLEISLDITTYLFISSSRRSVIATFPKSIFHLNHLHAHRPAHMYIYLYSFNITVDRPSTRNTYIDSCHANRALFLGTVLGCGRVGNRRETKFKLFLKA